MQPIRDVTIIAASARSLVESARRAGCENVIAFDFFADWDTQKSCQVTRVDSLEDAILQSTIRKVQLVFGGGFESCLNAIPGLHTLPLNCSLKAANCVRDLVKVSQLPFAAKAKGDLDPIGDPEQWIWKTANSSAGFGISENRSTTARTGFFQEFLQGSPFSSLHWSNGARAETLAVFRQLVGEPSLTKQKYQFCGAIGPLVLPELESTATKFAKRLVDDYGITGVFGVDWIHVDSKTWKAIEINPRITATAELWEASSGNNVFSAHIAGVKGQSFSFQPSQSTCGKVIPFNIEPTILVTQTIHDFMVELWQRKLAADVPCLGSVIANRQPICTLFCEPCELASWEEVKTKKSQLVDSWQDLKQILRANQKLA